MAKIYNYDVMFDDTSIDVSKEVALVWSIANSLRGAYTSDKYKEVIIPMVIIRRFECALAETKQAVVDKYLDEARVSHLQSVRIVHGKGTGALRNAVHQYLRRQKWIKSFRIGDFGEGDAGVTIVTLKN